MGTLGPSHTKLDDYPNRQSNRVVTLPGRIDSLRMRDLGAMAPIRAVLFPYLMPSNRLHIVHLPHFEALFEPSSIRRLSTDHPMPSPTHFLRLVNGFRLHAYSCR